LYLIAPMGTQRDRNAMETFDSCESSINMLFQRLCLFQCKLGFGKGDIVDLLDSLMCCYVGRLELHCDLS
jgi:hypothetical protein